jgi:hypothetical protein
MVVQRCGTATNRTIRRSENSRILNEVPFIEVVDRRELRRVGHLIRICNNRKHRDLREEKCKECGKQNGEDRMGIAIVEADMGKGIEFAVGHSAGEVQESIPNLADVT